VIEVGISARYAAIALPAAFGLAGCVDWRASLRTRAAFDLNCGADSLDVSEIGANQFGVVGCGCRATYVNVETSEAYPPRWVLNVTSGECQAQVPSAQETGTGSQQ
jgi:hypothetical protein